MATLVNELPVDPAVPIYAQYTITATATALSDSSILGTSVPPKKLTVKNAADATAALYVGSEIVANTPTNAGIQLSADQSYTFEDKSPAAIYLVGTANAANIAFIVAEF